LVALHFLLWLDSKHPEPGEPRLPKDWAVAHQTNHEAMFLDSSDGRSQAKLVCETLLYIFCSPRGLTREEA
jgi:hypothetical protein